MAMDLSCTMGMIIYDRERCNYHKNSLDLFSFAHLQCQTSFTHFTPPTSSHLPALPTNILTTWYHTVPHKEIHNLKFFTTLSTNLSRLRMVSIALWSSPGGCPALDEAKMRPLPATAVGEERPNSIFQHKHETLGANSTV